MAEEYANGMLRGWALFCLSVLPCCGSEPQTPSAMPSPQEVFNRTRNNVLQQLKQTTNYTCTEVVNRRYFGYINKNFGACEARRLRTLKREYMRDRLRLDVAVSDAGEIFSWHGGRQFSTAGIEAVVKSGAVSSGSFVDYLHNVFGQKAIEVRYGGHVEASPVSIYFFSFRVPLASSNQHVETDAGKVVVPFHGTFSVDDKSF